MVIVCEQCRTRFELADARIPPQGVRVRCSRCKHRFHVEPPAPRPAPTASPARNAENTAHDRQSPPASPRPVHAAVAEDDPDLDNPEFLFDDPAGRKSEDEPGPAPQVDDPFAEPASAPLLGSTGPDEPGSSLLGDPGELVEESASVESVEEERRRSRAQLGAPGTLLAPEDDLDPPRLPATPAETAPQRTDGARIEGVGPAPRSAPLEAETGDLFEDWDDLEEDAPGAPTPALRPLTPREDAPRPRAAAAPTALAPAQGRALLRHTDAEPEEEPAETTGRDRLGRSLRAGAVVVGLALAVLGLRALWNFAIQPPGPPSEVVAHGWKARGIESFHRTSDAGERVLVIRGALESLGSAWLPAVRAELLDAEGQPVGKPRYAEHVWLDGNELAPAALAARLQGGKQAPTPTPARRENRFTVLLPDPPGRASHYRLEIDETSGSPLR